jgi:malate/lactate dehydrogenase
MEMKESPKKVLNICLSGAAGRIAYLLLPKLCSGNIFGKDVHIKLNLLDLKSRRTYLEYILMELEDSAYTLLLSVRITEELKDAFDQIDLAILLGGNPRKPGNLQYSFSYKYLRITKN